MYMHDFKILIKRFLHFHRLNFLLLTYHVVISIVFVNITFIVYFVNSLVATSPAGNIGITTNPNRIDIRVRKLQWNC